MKNKKLALVILFITTFSFSNAQTFEKNEEEVTINKNGAMLNGTLYKTSNPNAPVVLIIAGSGPTDRDGNNVMMKNNSLLQLADSLAAYGIASLRYDKRGVGKTTTEEELDESKLRFEDYARDAVSWVDYLRNDRQYATIYILGHSEGSLLGMLAAQAKKVDGYISAAGAGFKADSVLRIQLASQPDYIKEDSYAILDSLAQGKLYDNPNPVLNSLFRESVQPYLISWFKYDPATEFKKLSCKKLVLQGDKDIQVSVADAERLYKADKTSTYVLIKDMNHIFKKIDGDRKQNITSYSNPSLPVMSEMIQAIVSFINPPKN